LKYNNNILGLILARSGSKGIKQKNISKLCGKPLIAWTINSALKSKRLTDVILSTDSTTIAKIGKKFGADVPFIRPLKFSKDKSPSIDAIEHAIKWLRKKGKNYEFVVLLEPTSPLRDHNDIDLAINKVIKLKAQSLVSVSKAVALHPAYLYKKTKTEKIKPFKTYKKKYIRRQDIEPVYFMEGTIYISKVSTLLKKKTFCHKNTLMYEVPKWKSFEIDDSLDLILVRAIIQNKQKK
jgi:N-acylneuraminate cytidylyltransferase/CMP-N,N'-diacetyllegionaminic acid synthase